CKNIKKNPLKPNFKIALMGLFLNLCVETMIIFHKISDLEKELAELRRKGLSTCFVPTMGALHQGHMSLVEKAKSVADLVVCSIFVNPAQFNEESDLDKYPRTIGADLKLLDQEGCHIVFIPEAKDIYAKNEFSSLQADYGSLTSTLEGEKRPGHFDGVATVVNRLFEIIQPNKACFGLKDFQQISIIRAMVKERRLPIEIIGCEIVREPSGLAMSSRNSLLKKEDLEHAAIIHKSMNWISQNMEKESFGKLREKAILNIEKAGLLKTEYLEFVDPDTFDKKDVSKSEKPVVVLFAGWISGVRLIDNILVQD
ncbi:MAG: pantoate--beta-alanine ligase, partial [Saprospiraceae bacterium]